MIASHKKGIVSVRNIEIKPKSIARGIVQVTAILAKGARIESCQKLKIITGRANTRAERVSTKASFIARVSGRK